METAFLPFEVQQKMAMGSSDPHACKISMLWNWYTIDSCFLARSWHVTSRGMFAGTCIGVFFWVMAYCWYHRLVVEFDRSVAEYKQVKYENTVGIDAVKAAETNCCCDEDDENTEKEGSVDTDPTAASNELDTVKPGSNFFGPLATALSHSWLVPKKDANLVYPSAGEHVARSGLYLVEWTCSYLIMLMWMYYNGYLIITMILGYFFGQIFFNYAPLAVYTKRELSEFPIRF